MTSFLPAIREQLMLVNRRSQQVVARRVELATTRTERRHGLLGYESLAVDTALVLAPCFAVHTVGMGFAIDVIFVTRDGTVRRIVRALRPWRIAASPGAFAVVELAAGASADANIAVGDQLLLHPSTGHIQ